MSGDEMTLGADALFQIAEPDTPSSRRRAPGRGIGIDLGTTHSLVSIAPNGSAPRVLQVEGSPLLPSVVAYAQGGDPVVGRAATQLRGTAGVSAKDVFSSVKRFVGRGAKDVDFQHPYDIGDEAGALRLQTSYGRSVSPVEVSAEILRALKERAEAELGEEVDGAVITVPAYFDDAQRQATKDAGRIAGLQVYRLLAEPTAAALAYGLDQGGQGLFAVFDLGGGTFDISVLRLRDGVFQVLATGGDSALGGDDFDRVVAHSLVERGLGGARKATSEEFQAALTAARTAKEALSSAEVVPVEVDALGLRCELTRADFEASVASLVRRCTAPCRRALKDAGVTAGELDGVVLVGGSTRMPCVRAAAQQVFKREPLTGVNPDEVVAHGAAIQADVLSGSAREGVTLLDVVPLSLGLETMGGVVEKIIPRNATIPIAARQVFTNYSEQQTAMAIHVVQGERELVSDCRSLARFELRGMPRLPPSMARVEVTFRLDADALLTVTARELMTGTKQSIEVKPTYGLGEEEVDRLVMESLDHAADDFEARNRAEGRTELGRVALAVRTAIEEVGDVPGLLGADERASITSELVRADAVMADPESAAKTLTEAREALEAASANFAQRRMERALTAGMSGKSLHEIEATLAEEAALDERRGGHSADLISED